MRLHLSTSGSPSPMAAKVSLKNKPRKKKHQKPLRNRTKSVP